MRTKIDENEISINVKSELSFTESMLFANNVLNEVVGNLDSAGLVIKDFIIKYNTIIHYSDFEMPDDYEQQYDIVYNSGLLETIITSDNFNKQKYRKLIDGIEEQLKFEIQKASSKTKLDDLFEAVTEIVKKFDGNLDVAKIGKMIDKLQKIEKLDEKALVETIMSLQKSKKNKKNDGVA